MDSVWDEGVTVLLVDGGDLLGNRNKNDKYQTEFLCRVTGDFGYDAIGLGERDLNYGLDFLYEIMEKHDLPFTNANVRRADTGELILPEYLVVEKNGIKFGIVSVLDPNQRIITMTSKDAGLEIEDPVAVLRALLPRVRQEADTIVLAGHLGDKLTDRVIKEVKGIDICVKGHTRRTEKTERILEDTVILAAAHEGQWIARADIFVDDATGKLMAVDVTATSLDSAIPDNVEMKAEVAAYKAGFAEYKLGKRAAYPRNQGSAEEEFLGERVCRSCHQAAWDSYAKSGHRGAFASIRNKGQNYEPECIVCHTTGYQFHNGYSEERPFNSLVNVQCEACHGYGSQHDRDGGWLAQAKDSCVVCHDQENSPEFDYATYWEKIKH